MDVEVGEHHASPPPPYSWEWPEWDICEYSGTSRVMPAAVPGCETDGTPAGSRVATVCKVSTAGDGVPAPLRRISRTWTWYDATPPGSATRQVSTATSPR